MYELEDEFVQRLHGTHPSSPFFGIPYVIGDLVQVMQCVGGIVPPNADGSASVFTPVLFTTRIGEGTAPLFEQSGLFADAVVPRPSGNVFIRVFNAPTLEEATFYTDSHIHSMEDAGDALFRIEVTRTTQPIDPNDDDDDGLNNSWEKSYGSHSDDADSDDDGISDGLEHMAGTDPMDEDSHFGMLGAERDGASVVLSWTAIVGEDYAVESFCLGPEGTDAVTVVGPLTATNAHSQATVANAFTAENGCYRVIKVIE